MSVVPLRSSCREVEFAHADAVFIGVYYGWPSARVLEAQHAAQSELMRVHPRFYTLAIIPDFGMGAASPGPGAERDKLVDMSVSKGADFEGATVANAMVILPRGMVGVVIRTFMATMLLHPRMRSKVTICSTLAEAEASLRRVATDPPLPTDLAGQVAAWLRSKQALAAGQANG